MNSGPTKLDELPIEIIRRIASVGACEAALALSKVNRTLHAACNDTLVYKAIIDNRNGNGGSKWHHNCPLSMGSPVSSWARYALADSLAAHCDISSVKPTSTTCWAPQLLVYHHPLVNELARALLEPNETETPALAFCFTLRLMSEEPAIIGERAWEKLMFNTQQRLRPPTDAYDHLAACSPETLSQNRVQALLAVGILAVNLRELMEIVRVRRLSNILPQPWDLLLRTATVTVPTSTSIPFHFMMDVPLPFSPNAAIKFASCHLAKMTTVDFLEDGEWAGYYSLRHWRDERVPFDPPMHGIRFVGTTNSDSTTTLNLRGTGEDAVGAFDLEGKLAPETGHLVLRKTYSGGSPVWDWVCIMTPVGIVGSWGEDIYGGWIWLWKTGWTTDHHA